MNPSHTKAVYRFVGGGIMVGNDQIGRTSTQCVERACELREFYAEQLNICLDRCDYEGARYMTDRIAELGQCVQQATDWKLCA